ncbi:hypothetical protein D9M68_571580 [compost metagenome]
MVVLGEQRLVLQRHLQQRRMQVGEGGLADVRQVFVIENEVEQHADQVDDVGFLLGQFLLAGQAAVGFQLLLQVGLEFLDGLRVLQTLRQLLSRFFLQAVQRIQQVAGAVGARRPAWGKAADAAGGAQHGAVALALAVFAEQRRQPAEQRPGILGWRFAEVEARRQIGGGRHAGQGRGGRRGRSGWRRSLGARCGGLL